MPLIAILNGPNLNLLGTREPERYGRETLSDIERHLRWMADEVNVELTFFQSNHEGLLIDTIHELRERVDAIIINPGGLTHTSVALRDALLAVDKPIYEVHISNIHAREEFRHHSYISDIAVGVICGLGTRGYEYALREAATRLRT
ncbi:MAG: type II 3-dehydroquinate dehydratase [Sumerlaeia bacterium]